MTLRQPIVVTMGHVDHGKTSILDAIRSTRVQAKEAGAITQSIGASEVPADVILTTCGKLLAKLGIKLTLPGLLFIDTPGHEAFTNLRKRGGSIADIAILVIDVTKGVEAQTIEAMDILREYKTPFVIALNKTDAIDGWRANEGECFSDTIVKQRDDVQARLDEKVYALVGELYKYGFSAERFDRVSDFTKQIVMIPVSAKRREGLQELLMYVAGLAQKFLEKNLELHSTEGKASILEVREERGLGDTLDVILYDGIIRVGDEIVFAGRDAPIKSRIKALLKLKPLTEMREGGEFVSVDEAGAACGVKISCERAGEALAGSSLFAVNEGNEEKALDDIRREMTEIITESESVGTILRADALGSLEAIARLLKAEGIPLKSTGVGSPSRKDVATASSIREKEPFLGVIFAFNVSVEDDVRRSAEESGVKLFDEKIIYNLIDGYNRWVGEEKERERKEAFSRIILPAKVLVMDGCCFRVSNPCICGVEVLEGRIRKEIPLVNKEGERVGVVRSIQHEKEGVDEAKKGEQVAISMSEPFFGRQIRGKDVLYSDMSREDIKVLEEKYPKALSDGEKELLAEIKKRKGIITSFFS
ncbi:translation initiation factor IF-2 [Candidatus Micrarchaeota archaeon CG10_big_fil_rev_8_21_14_0_10_59_7]|nr:MAG: translation initiation factor IF-2 [Candidatus Micrarchaeota archaeon CG10_big_fil_rev_8_21_14_0_10_59_7]